MNVLHVTGSAVGFAARGAVTSGASRARRRAIDGIEGQMATVARQATLRVALNSRHNFHPLIVQRMKLIAAPFLLLISRQTHHRQLP